MNWKHLTCLLGVPTFLLCSAIAQADEIEVQTRGVNIYRDQNGNISVNTGNIQLNSLSNSSFRRTPFSRQYRHYNVRECRGNNRSQQSSQQVYQSGSTVSQTTVSYSCR